MINRLQIGLRPSAYRVVYVYVGEIIWMGGVKG